MTTGRNPRPPAIQNIPVRTPEGDEIKKVLRHEQQVSAYAAYYGGKTVTQLKPLTTEKMRSFLDACSWGDVPDWAHALVAYLSMEGYVVAAKPLTIGRPKKGFSPTEPGHYWAKWKIAAEGTKEGDDLTPSDRWEIVQVNENIAGGYDPNEPESLSVSVPGVEQTQWPDGFFWGPKVPDYNNKV